MFMAQIGEAAAVLPVMTSLCNAHANHSRALGPQPSVCAIAALLLSFRQALITRGGTPWAY